MTKEEALVSIAIGRALTYAIKSNQYARKADPITASSCTESVEFYTKWLVDHGHKVELEVAGENGARRVLTLVVDGKVLVRGGVYANKEK